MVIIRYVPKRRNKQQKLKRVPAITPAWADILFACGVETKTFKGEKAYTINGVPVTTQQIMALHQNLTQH